MNELKETLESNSDCRARRLAGLYINWDYDIHDETRIQNHKNPKQPTTTSRVWRWKRRSAEGNDIKLIKIINLCCVCFCSTNERKGTYGNSNFQNFKRKKIKNHQPSSLIWHNVLYSISFSSLFFLRAQLHHHQHRETYRQTNRRTARTPDVDRLCFVLFSFFFILKIKKYSNCAILHSILYSLFIFIYPSIHPYTNTTVTIQTGQKKMKKKKSKENKREKIELMISSHGLWCGSLVS